MNNDCWSNFEIPIYRERIAIDKCPMINDPSTLLNSPKYSTMLQLVFLSPQTCFLKAQFPSFFS